VRASNCALHGEGPTAGRPGRWSRRCLTRFAEAAPVYVSGIEQRFAAGLSEAELRTLADVLQRVRERQA
jgi:hypothetical protein